MTKSGTDRSDKYGQKFDATVIQARYTATAESAKAKQVVMQQLLADKNAAVRGILNVAGTYPIQSVQYQAFGNKLFGVCNKFANLTGTPHVISQTAIAQATIEIAKWGTYGSEPEVLKLIWNLYADMLGTAPSPIPTIS